MPLSIGRRLRILLVLATAASCTSSGSDCWWQPCPYSCGRVCDFDAGADATVDAHDAAHAVDASARLDGSDSSEGDPGWTHFADVPTDCALDVAMHPENVRQSLETVGCGTGCRTLVLGIVPGAAWRIEDRTIVGNYDGEFSAPIQTYYRYITDLDGGTLAAFRSRENTSDHTVGLCLVDAFAANGTDIAFDVSYQRWDASGNNIAEAWVRLYRGPYAGNQADAHRLGEWVQPASVPGFDSPSGVGLGPDYGSFVLDGVLFVVEPDGSVESVDRSVLGTDGTPFHLGPDILFGVVTPTTQQVQIMRSLHGMAATAYRTLAAGDVMNLDSDGTTIAWLEGTGYDVGTTTYASIALWTGTYDTDLHATRVRDLGAHRRGNPRVGGGYYVQDEDDDATMHHVYAAYRLSDGARATFNPASGRAAQRTEMVSSTEILCSEMSNVYRIDPRALSFM